MLRSDSYRRRNLADSFGSTLSSLPESPEVAILFEERFTRHQSNSNVLSQLTEASAESRAVSTDSDSEIGRPTAEFN